MNVLLFAGTSEGKEIAHQLAKSDYKATVCIATEYGKELLSDIENINVIRKRQSQSDIESLLDNHDIVIDATHPYASEITKNIIAANKKCNKKYYRIIRDFFELDNAYIFEDYETLVSFLNEVDGNVLITTGAKVLKPYTKVNEYQERLFFRILPMIESIEHTKKHGIKPSHLVAMQGPFSIELNKALLEHFDCRYLVTKNTGISGGLIEKVNSCQQLGVKLLIINNEIEHGIKVQEIIDLILRNKL